MEYLRLADNWAVIDTRSNLVNRDPVLVLFVLQSPLIGDTPRYLGRGPLCRLMILLVRSINHAL